MGAVAQLQSGGQVVQDVLDGALAVAELAGDFRGVVAVGDQPQYLRLAFGQAGKGQTTWSQHLALQPADLAQQTADQRWRTYEEMATRSAADFPADARKDR